MELKSFRLVTLGRMSLTGNAGEDESLGKRRLKLALLALLAVSRRAFPREVLVDTFWGAQDEEHARHSLSDALSHLRRVLGRDALTTRAAEVQLDPRAPLTVDALDLAEAAANGDHARVVQLYRGPFLDGVHVERSPRFENWVSRERDRLERLFLSSVPAACQAFAAAGDIPSWRDAAERWVEVAPASSSAARSWLAALAAPGTRQALEAAVAGFERWAARLRRDGDAAPDADLLADVTSYRSALAQAPPQSGGAPAAPPAPARRRPVTARLVAAGVAAVGLALAATLLLWPRPRPPAAPPRPVIAVLSVRNVRRDSASAWLEDGLQQMLIADLARAGSPGGSGALDVIDPSLLRDAVQRQGPAREGDLTTAQAVELGRGVGATWVVTGGVTRGEGVYVLDITVRRVADGAPVQVYSVVGNDVLTVADRAAAQVLAVVDARARGPRLADVETGNVGAYQHFVRAIQAQQEGRPDDVDRELDAAIALDSGFVSAIVERMRQAALANDTTKVHQLTPLFARAGARVTRWDRLELDAHAAEHDGEHDRAEALARELVTDYPRDPRGYDELAEILTNHGKWREADSVLKRLLALDSLATAAGTGPCVPCAAYGGMAELRLTEGDIAGAERATRQWIALQPDLPGPWRDLGSILSFEGRYGPALEATARSVALSAGDLGFTLRLGVVRLMARDFRGVDSLVRLWRRAPEAVLRLGALDLEAMEDRERGAYRASNRVLDGLVAQDTGSSSLRLMEANSLARLGRRADASAAYERIERARMAAQRASTGTGSPLAPLTGDWARAFCWHHALQAEALAAWWPGDAPPQVDTVRLRALADSIETVSARSYYGRDWRLAHHVRGLIAMAGRRYAEAVQEFEEARWGAAGWTATDAMLAQAYLALGRTDGALTALRAAYEGPLDAMGRYVPRTDIDFLMALAFDRAGQKDSAAVYAAYVRRAWTGADPELRRRLAALLR